MFKMIKLLRLLFGQIKLQHKEIEKQIAEERIKSKEQIILMQRSWEQVIGEFHLKMLDKDAKTKQLEEQVSLVVDNNERLRKRLDELLGESQQKIMEFEKGKWNSLAEIMDEV